MHKNSENIHYKKSSFFFSLHNFFHDIATHINMKTVFVHDFRKNVVLFFYCHHNIYNSIHGALTLIFLTSISSSYTHYSCVLVICVCAPNSNYYGILYATFFRRTTFKFSPCAKVLYNIKSSPRS